MQLLLLLEKDKKVRRVRLSLKDLILVNSLLMFHSSIQAVRLRAQLVLKENEIC
jgi:hypothetical protein